MINKPSSTLSVNALRKNDQFINKARSALSAITGISAGIMGLQGWMNGITLYLFTSSLLSFSIYIFSTRMNSEKYFLSKKGLLVDGVFSNLLSYLLFWTLSFALVFVYE